MRWQCNQQDQWPSSAVRQLASGMLELADRAEPALLVMDLVVRPESVGIVDVLVVSVAVRWQRFVAGGLAVRSLVLGKPQSVFAAVPFLEHTPQLGSLLLTPLETFMQPRVVLEQIIDDCLVLSLQGKFLSLAGLVADLFLEYFDIVRLLLHLHLQLLLDSLHLCLQTAPQMFNLLLMLLLQPGHFPLVLPLHHQNPLPDLLTRLLPPDLAHLLNLRKRRERGRPHGSCNLREIIANIDEQLLIIAQLAPHGLDGSQKRGGRLQTHSRQLEQTIILCTVHPKPIAHIFYMLKQAIRRTFSTIFDKILKKEIPSKTVYEDTLIYAFRDISPVAPTHILIIPKNKDGLSAISQASERHTHVLGHMLVKAAAIAAQEGLGNGYRLVINDGKEGQQTVDHLHIHLIGGKQLKWPPG